MKKFIRPLVTSIILSTIFVVGCKERIPVIYPGTAPYYELHGIINDGKTINEITLVNERNTNAPKMRFPAAIPVGVITHTTKHVIDPENTIEIRKGFANQVMIGLRFTRDKRLVPTSSDVDEKNLREKDELGAVGIHFIASLGPTTNEKTEARLDEIAAQSIRSTDKLNWKLREYIPSISGEIQGFTYVPFDTNFRSIDGTRIYFGCGDTGNNLLETRPAGCAANFNTTQGLAVTYLFEAELLPYWRELHSEVVRVSNSFLVK